MIHLKLALRTLIHYKMYTVINMAGMAISLACTIIIARYVHSELTVDGFNTKLDRIYRVTTEQQNKEEMHISVAGTGRDYRMGKSFVDLSGNPGVEKHSSFRYSDNSEIVVDNQAYGAKLLSIDTVFLQILDYPVIAGVNNVRRPEDVLVTEAFAARMFGREDPLGKTLDWPALKKTLTVAGIIRTPAYRSVLSFDMLVSSQQPLAGEQPQNLILLYPGIDYRDVNRQHGEYSDVDDGGHKFRYQLFPYRDLYFDRQNGNPDFARGNITYVFILSGIGILLLLTGLVNYVNLNSVVTTRRNRELGMKKVFGAEGYRVFLQLILENMLLIVASLIIAFWLAGAVAPFMENTIGVMQYPNLQFDLQLSLALALALPVIVSIIPFLRYRYFSPVRSLQSVNAGNKSLFSRRFFLCFQYCLTVGLITVSLFFVKQLNFMLDKDVGFRTHDIISVPFIKLNPSAFTGTQEEAMKSYERDRGISIELKQKLDASPLIENWSFGKFPTGYEGDFSFKVPEGELQSSSFMTVGEEWFKVFEIKLLEGQLWNSETDISSYNLIVSESTLKQYGITDYREGRLIPFARIVPPQKSMESGSLDRIVGVVKDFHIAHLSKQLSPVVFYFSAGSFYEPVVASFVPEQRKEVIEFMKNLYDELVGGEFTYTFIEDEIAKLYSDDKKVAVICTAFTGMAILISMLGLLGVSLFDIRQRRREIAIRKINGAMMKDVVRLLLKRYFALLGVAFVVSVPITLFVILKYLENFAYKAPISWWLFAVALAVTVVISLLTLTYQVYKAGTEPPAEVVKN